MWLVLAGVWMAIGYITAGVLQCITIIGIPFGIQAFKLAGYALWPFGRVVVQRTDRDAALSCLGNVTAGPASAGCRCRAGAPIRPIGVVQGAERTTRPARVPVCVPWSMKTSPLTIV